VDDAARVAEEGYAVLERAVEPDLVAALVEAIDRSLAALDVPLGANEFLGRRTRRLFNLLARDPLFAR
jgi:hypothetical protein